MTSTPPKRRWVSAAGTVAVRQRGGETEVLLVHRPRYGDWSLPKGKLIECEYLPVCAVRETLEESGVRVRLGAPLDRIAYDIDSGVKTVSYWYAEVAQSSRFKPCDEVDRRRWLPVEKAIAKSSYPEEPALIRQAVALASSTPVLIVRHGKAMARAAWDGRDQDRPLAERGRRQSALLVGLLNAFGVGRAVSSSSARCMSTLEPFAQAQHLVLEGADALTEEDAERDTDAVVALMKQLVAQTVESGVPLAVCGHRPVLPAMFKALGVPNRRIQPATCVVAHVGADGVPVAVEVHRPCV